MLILLRCSHLVWLLDRETEEFLVAVVRLDSATEYKSSLTCAWSLGCGMMSFINVRREEVISVQVVVNMKWFFINVRRKSGHFSAGDC